MAARTPLRILHPCIQQCPNMAGEIVKRNPRIGGRLSPHNDPALNQSPLDVMKPSWGCAERALQMVAGRRAAII